MTAKTFVIAKFEFTKTIRRKGFIVGMFILPALMLLFFWLSSSTGVGMGVNYENQTFGFIDGAGFLHASPCYISYSDVNFGKEALIRKDINCLFIVPQNYLQTGTFTVFTMDTSLIRSKETVYSIHEFIAKNLLIYTNVPDAIAQKVLTPDNPEVIALDGYGTVIDNQTLEGLVLPLVFTLVLALGILTSSSYLMQGIGEEKENRRGEFLLSYCSAEELLAGKILGYGAVSFVQIIFWALIGLIVMMISSFSSLFAGMQSTWLLLVAVLYFILGYFLFSVSIACTASLVPSLREAQQVLAIFSLFAVLPMVFLDYLMEDPNSFLMQIMTYFPYTAPFIAMARLALTSVPLPHIALSLAILVLSIGILIKLSAKIFRMGMLTYGKRATLKEVYKSLMGE
jgi:ABC-2 type transport system permease protein